MRTGVVYKNRGMVIDNGSLYFLGWWYRSIEQGGYVRVRTGGVCENMGGV